MKHFGILLIICGGTFLTAGCQSPLVIRSPIGPVGRESGGPNGHLLVFSAEEARGGGDDQTYFQHTDYAIYNSQGKRIQSVDNAAGHFDEAPRMVRLPPGRYRLKARAEGYGLVELPVVIHEGRTTVVRLDEAPKLSSSQQDAEFVTLPGGYLIGWRASPSHFINDQ